MPRRSPKVIRPVDPREDAALDAAPAASFPASDPVAALEPAAERSRSQPRATWPARLHEKDSRP